MNLHDRFEAWDDEYLEFDRVKNKRSQRPDLHAFLLLDELFPQPGFDMLCGAEHDEVWLSVKLEQVENLTDEQILELVRCGVRHCNDHNCLGMFV